MEITLPVRRKTGKIGKIGEEKEEGGRGRRNLGKRREFGGIRGSTR